VTARAPRDPRRTGQQKAAQEAASVGT